MMIVKNYFWLPILLEMLAVCILNCSLTFFRKDNSLIFHNLSVSIMLSSVGLACSGPFWKKMESIFASVSREDMSYLKQQVISGILR